jgi:uncharacterized protein YukE
VGLSNHVERQLTQLHDKLNTIQSIQATDMRDVRESQASLLAQLGQLAEKVDKMSDALDGLRSSESDVWRRQVKTSSASIGTWESPEPITFTRLSTESKDEPEPSNIAIVVSGHTAQEVDSNRAQAEQDVKEAEAAITTLSSKLKKIGSFLVLHIPCTVGLF